MLRMNVEIQVLLSACHTFRGIRKSSTSEPTRRFPYIPQFSPARQNSISSQSMRNPSYPAGTHSPAKTPRKQPRPLKVSHVLFFCFLPIP
ncbi:hypothetical protein VTL71DRAFT_2202 [Oculimacula yallundae]|uniref:Uncharacterized protein n=1 Tax=Oculimacula yallundae TaxID=86028 RepID=A0ABR4C875_9HELO